LVVSPRKKPRKWKKNTLHWALNNHFGEEISGLDREVQKTEKKYG